MNFTGGSGNPIVIGMDLRNEPHLSVKVVGVVENSSRQVTQSASVGTLTVN